MSICLFVCYVHGFNLSLIMMSCQRINVYSKLDFTTRSSLL